MKFRRIAQIDQNRRKLAIIQIIVSILKFNESKPLKDESDRRKIRKQKQGPNKTFNSNKRSGDQNQRQSKQRHSSINSL